jgi:hypothetical protein
MDNYNSPAKKYRAGLIGFIEDTIRVEAICKVLTQLDNWINLYAYSGGIVMVQLSEFQ